MVQTEINNKIVQQGPEKGSPRLAPGGGAVLTLLFTLLFVALSGMAYHGTITILKHHDSLFLMTTTQPDNVGGGNHRRLLVEEGDHEGKKPLVLDVYVSVPSTDGNDYNDDKMEHYSPSIRKYFSDLHAMKKASGAVRLGDIQVVSKVALNDLEQQNWMRECSGSPADNRAAKQQDVHKRFQKFISSNQQSLAMELRKFCYIASALKASTQDSVLGSTNGMIWLDAASPFLWTLPDLLEHVYQDSVTTTKPLNVAVLGDDTHGLTRKTIHGSLFVLPSLEGLEALAENMIDSLTLEPIESILHNPLYVPRRLHDEIEATVDGSTLRLGPNSNRGGYAGWFLLEQKCHLLFSSAVDSNGSSNNNNFAVNQLIPSAVPIGCPLANGGFCCRVMHGSETILLTRHPLFPTPNLQSDLVPKPFNAETQHYKEQDLPYIATLREQVFPRPEGYVSKNMFDILMDNQCLPDALGCARCLRLKTGANCQTCAKECTCYCKALCKEKPDPKHVAKKIYVTPPKYARDPSRLIPRIVHQTYFEELTPDKYPNMSRMVESFKQSGWDYRFWSDEDAQNFLSTHFPAEVRQAYDMLRPGAFKADLFRYCALLITGGVYADVDIVLESNLDASMPFDAGFVVPVDEPGSEAGVPMCVWNGLIGAAPGHPFLAHVIQTVVNQVRNRFTSVDVDATFCPDPELSVLHAFDTLFTAGPCALGAAINRVLGRKGQTPFQAGELKPAAHVSHDQINIPGRTIILHQNKWDMGGHRFTLLEQNLLVAATDLPESDDRESAAAQEGAETKTEHYSKTHASVGIYGLDLLYADGVKAAHEDVHFEIVAAAAATTTKPIEKE